MKGLKMKIKINCDMGESFGIYKMCDDEKIMPYIDMANLACGFHAGDALTMSKAINLSSKHNVEIGAHPSYQDLVGFGRRSMNCSLEEIKAIILYQMAALDGMAKAFNRKITYLKPHGALYHDMMNNEDILKTIIKAIAAYDPNIKLMLLSSPKNKENEKLAQSYGIALLYEVFADRNYNDDGSLVSRANSDALVEKETDVLERITLLKNEGYLYSKNNKKLFLQADAICVHGDGENALAFVKKLNSVLH